MSICKIYVTSPSPRLCERFGRTMQRLWRDIVSDSEIYPPKQNKKNVRLQEFRWPVKIKKGDAYRISFVKLTPFEVELTIRLH